MRRKIGRNLPYFLIGIIAVVAVSTILFMAANNSNVNNENENVCPDGGDWVKVEGTAPSYTAPGGEIIEAVCVKGGNESSPNEYLHTFTEDGWYTVEGENCVGVSGIGTGSASAYHGPADENICAEISHASFRIAEKEVTPTNTEPPKEETSTFTPTLTSTATEPPKEETPTPTSTTTEPPKEETSTPTSTATEPPKEETPTPTFTLTPSITASEPPKEETPTLTPTNEPQDDPLTVIGECEQTSVLWTVSNDNDEAISFTWKAENGQSGEGIVQADSTAEINTDLDATSITVFYNLNEQPAETQAFVDCAEDPTPTPTEEPKEEDTPTPAPTDPSPDVDAGGSGPSIGSIMTLFGISGLGLGMVIYLISKLKKHDNV